MREEAVVFGRASALVGVITDPPAGGRPAHAMAVILLNAGLLHRVAPNRLYVELARGLAAQGFAAFRFDFSGIGDSNVRRNSLPFEKSIVNTARVDARVVGAVLINPQGYDEDVTSRADARRYWKKVFRVLIDPRRWGGPWSTAPATTR